ncbi:phenylacetate-CoA oxygenase subunit PaaJ (plasmid) [Rhodococcus oxybenzonivorans]|uniref:Phenylacetate-CoA oxygenase subunit PaaJ n=1 Tax=Rhodococcus oxybenzonivorans TaxID=1990687 RepID=A0A2S2C718_9NOCA|nr:1,2-phenylacetyl-CoA epoxidase subunit PaaD [Rhodococcus oxybenzonivorans]AWK76642.1 phenylacetate-CoA oxygenase subunit PaaJ [Rhodococcus oxybenzonivorans]
MDPEMPLLTLDDLGVLRDVEVRGDGSVLVTITPTYSGCPAMATIRDDIEHKLRDNGYTSIEIATSLTPAWSTDWISDEGRCKLRDTGYSVPGPAPARTPGPVPLTLTVKPRELECPQCGSSHTRLTSEFGATLCKAQYRCDDCLEPFDHVKEI